MPKRGGTTNVDHFVRSRASRIALGTYEILEKILSNLPLRKLVKAQRVCKEWKGLIGRSKTLQQNLFLEPILVGSSEGTDTDANADIGRLVDDDRGVTHYINENEDDEQDLDHSWGLNCDHNFQECKQASLQVHPLLKDALFTLCCQHCEAWQYRLISDDALEEARKWPTAFKEPSKLVARPAVKQIVAYSCVQSSMEIRFHNRNGIRLHHVLAGVEEQAYQWVQSGMGDGERAFWNFFDLAARYRY